MLLIYDLKKGIVHISLLHENINTIYRGLYINSRYSKDIKTTLILNFNFSLPNCFLIPDFRFIIKNKYGHLFLLITINFVNRILSVFGKIRKYFEKDCYFYFLFFFLFFIKFVVCGSYSNELFFSNKNELDIGKLKSELFEYKSRKIYFGNNSNLISLELDSLKFMSNIKFAKIIKKSESNVLNDRKILVTYYAKLFVINDKFEKLLPFHKCLSIKGDFYLYHLNINKKEQIIISNDFFNRFNLFNVVFIPYDKELIESKENLCKLMG